VAQVGAGEVGTGEVDAAQVLIAEVGAAQIGVGTLALGLEYAAVDRQRIVIRGEGGRAGEQGQWQEQAIRAVHGKSPGAGQ